MRIAEIYVSIQGEAEYAGEETVFVRLTGCNLRCGFCDTPFTSWAPEGVQRRWEDVLDEVLSYGVRHIDVTGGEPLLQPEVVPLTRALREAGRFVTVETAATVFRPLSADLISISPKRANSTPEGAWQHRHDAQRDRPQVVAQFLAGYPCQFKFVIDRPADLDDAAHYLRSYPQVSPEQIWVMPQAIDTATLEAKSPWLRNEAARRGWRFSPRLHIEQFGNVRGR